MANISKVLLPDGTVYNIKDSLIWNATTDTSGTAAVTTSPYTASIWRVNLPSITELYTGLTILYKVPVAGDASYGTLLRIDGTDSSEDSITNLYPVCTAVKTMIGTRYAVGSMVALTFDAGQYGLKLYYNSTSAYTTTASGTGWKKKGCWKVSNDYDSGNTKTTAGSSNSTDDLYIIGAGSQASSATTYSNGNVKIKDGCLFDSSGRSVGWDEVIDSTDNITSSSTDTEIPTAKAVWDLVDGLPEPMIFKGSVGTGGTVEWNALPSAASTNIGYTYKVITDHSTTPICKVGDTIISDGTNWVIIPSGDDPSGTGTVTSVKIEATSPIAIDDSSAITTSGVRTISHSNSGATAGSYGDSSAQTPDFGDTFKVPYVTVNATGHVTGISEHTVTVPNETHNSHALTVTNGTASSTSGTITYVESVEGCTATSGDLTATTTRKSVAIPTIPSNNVTGSGTSGYLTKWNGTNTITDGPQITSGGTGFLKEDGTWSTPTDNKVTQNILSTSGWTAWRPLLVYSGTGYSSVPTSSSNFSTITSDADAWHDFAVLPETGTLSTTNIWFNGEMQSQINDTTGHWYKIGVGQGFCPIILFINTGWNSNSSSSYVVSITPHSIGSSVKKAVITQLSGNSIYFYILKIGIGYVSRTEAGRGYNVYLYIKYGTAGNENLKINSIGAFAQCQAEQQTSDPTIDESLTFTAGVATTGRENYFGSDNNDRTGIVIQTATSGVPYLYFLRGTTSDDYTDWRIQDRVGLLEFMTNANGTYTTRYLFGDANATFNGTSSSTLQINSSHSSETGIIFQRNETNKGGIGYNNNGVFLWNIGGSKVIYFTDDGQFIPNANNSYDLGTSSNRWKNFYTNYAYSTNGFFQTSDERKKHIISDLDLDKAYDLIDKCQTILYTIKDDKSNKEEIGMLAQEVREFFPEIVSENEDGELSLDYSRLTVIILKVLKDIIKRLNKLERKEQNNGSTSSN